MQNYCRHTKAYATSQHRLHANKSKTDSYRHWVELKLFICNRMKIVCFKIQVFCYIKPP